MGANKAAQVPPSAIPLNQQRARTSPDWLPEGVFYQKPLLLLTNHAIAP